jgi:glucose-1-phosphate adenylyltransferase
MGNDYYQTLDEIRKSTDKGIPPLGIGERCYVKNAIIDKNCRVGNDVRINGGKHLPDGEYDTHVVEDGVVVIKKGSILPDGFTI